MATNTPNGFLQPRSPLTTTGSHFVSLDDATTPLKSNGILPIPRRPKPYSTFASQHVRHFLLPSNALTYPDKLSLAHVQAKVLSHDPDLLRQRAPAHRPRLHDDRG